MQKVIVTVIIISSLVYLLRCLFRSFQSCETNGCGSCPTNQKL